MTDKPEELYCSSCKKFHRVGKFYEAPDTARGYSYICKEAKTRQARLKYNKKTLPHPNRLAPDGMKWCNYHKEYHPLDAFPPNPQTESGRASFCHSAHREIKKAKEAGGSS